jgi:tetratricopeptide (TPR) repeat protein
MHSVGLKLRAAAAAMILMLAGGAAASAQGCHNEGATPDEVIAACTRLISAGRLDAETRSKYFNNRGYAHMRKRSYDRAIEDFDEATRINPRNVTAYANRGAARREKGQEDRAFDEFNRAIALDPKFAGAYFERSVSYKRKKDFERALADINLAINLAPKTARYFNERGNLYFDLKRDYSRAIDNYNQAISLAPQVAIHYSNRGVAYDRTGLKDKAAADYERAIRLEPTNPIPFNSRGLSRRRGGDLAGAIADFNQALRLDPKYSWAYTNRGQAYEAMGDSAAARADYLAAVSLPPKYATGQAAIDTARARLAALSGAGVTLPPPTPPVTPTPSRPAVAPTPDRPAIAPPGPQYATPPPGPASPAGARKLALVLGNSAYQRQPLRNPDNDARAMAKVLRQIGFQVIDGYNLDYAGMRRVISEFAVKSATAQLVLVYYAGHGLGISGHNYLVPIDAKMEAAAAASFELFDLDQIITSIEDPARATVIILDACRNNPFATQATVRALTRGGGGLVGYDSVAAGMLIAFATRPGQVAKDGGGDHSPFTAALLKYIATPNLEILDMLRRVRRDVLQETNGEQITWDNESLFGDVFLVDGGTRATAK